MLEEPLGHTVSQIAVCASDATDAAIGQENLRHKDQQKLLLFCLGINGVHQYKHEVGKKRSNCKILNEVDESMIRQITDITHNAAAAVCRKSAFQGLSR